MNIRLKNFLSHDDTQVEIPERGIVLVTGPNGSGKSSLIEAVAWALWGKTLRGAAPWREGQECSVTVTLPNGEAITRSRSAKGKTELRFGAIEYETATRAQEALDTQIPTFDAWRRTCVFSSADAAHFATATDGERKRLLEAILGLGRFDEALLSCRRDLKHAENVAAEAQSAHALTEQAVKFEKRRLADAEAELSELPVVQEVQKVYPHDLNEQSAKVADLRKACRSADIELARLREKQAASANQLAALSHDKCPTCEQDLKGAKIVVDLNVRLNATNRAVDIAIKAAEISHAELELADAALQSLRDQKAAFDLWEDRQQARKQVQRRIAQAQKAIETQNATLAQYFEALTVAKREQAVLEACEEVLGLRGVRAAVLAKALKGIEGVANSWLNKIAGQGMRLKLLPYSEKKSGGYADAISLAVDGAGGGNGYVGASGGERRRIDVALLMALAEVSNTDGGTLFFDECMDALDEVGVAAVSSALEDLSSKRAVVVVSHSVALIRGIKADQRWHVSNGTVSR